MSIDDTVTRALPDSEALDLFRELLAIPSPSGREHRLAERIEQHLRDIGYEPESDSAGNLVVPLGSRPHSNPPCLIAAHIDEIGAVVTSIADDGSLRVRPSGGLHPWKLGESPVQVLGDADSIMGVFSMGSTHGVRDGDSDRAVGWESVRIVTGLPPDELRERGITPGAQAVPAEFVRGPIAFGESADPLIAAWTFDDRMGVVAMLRVLKRLRDENREPAYPTIFAFTVHEESGGEGAKWLARQVSPCAFVAVDGCPIPEGTQLELDGRPGIWTKDRLVHYDLGLMRALDEAAHRAGTELQRATYDATLSDASAVRSVGAAPRAACFGHVRDNSHGYEIARLSVFDNVYATLWELVASWGGPS